MTNQSHRLERDDLGSLVLIDHAGTRHVGVYPVRAFPITAIEAGIGLMDSSGKELCWFPDTASIPQNELELIQAELATREFMPVIERIVKVSTFATPSIWDIQTDRGPTRIRLKGEEDIRRISGNTLLISDANGLQFLIKDSTALDKGSKKLLDRFR
ncbi:DUF1854 domain-containing protein [Polynucleobacter paneuropaeus]|jgi:hypothetical protein|uniref:DUF1854 domain-containing protein n=1 Tax=Polynucleobacter paneuropaeus TaxID=2527775 RepID=A0A2Z4JTH8_9BURK|nr:DUF1854 domain-containing protein [Polynucleobacter paneuropaeus]AWW44197.1 DUF1854 domain-containing protein [Polynucleobacter paneuropaeus]AWW45789.1 DUF1854 domain-containing protein [Polynucleobacter paneuropaeus]AWW50080.1 DUF1854 domain-containing protein [Polynucleobacter paneuropaeus]MBT8513922.1 DUF1854 domain-containing protein [Polynucleobacter paneuropaeus]MBT8515698.1 DUF1854 domain-containing protein [Polynucleobacter paneuropaeus]